MKAEGGRRKAEVPPALERRGIQRIEHELPADAGVNLARSFAMVFADDIEAALAKEKKEAACRRK